jgi:hypothetical protein
MDIYRPKEIKYKQAQGVRNWRPDGFSRGFVDYFENGEHIHTQNRNTKGLLNSPYRTKNEIEKLDL